MSATALKAVAEYLATGGGHLPDSRRKLLLALADHADQHGVSWPKVKTLAGEIGRCERTIQRGLNHFERLGVLDTVPWTFDRREVASYRRIRLPGIDGEMADAIERRTSRNGTQGVTATSVKPSPGEGDMPMREGITPRASPTSDNVSPLRTNKEEATDEEPSEELQNALSQADQADHPPTGWVGKGESAPPAAPAFTNRGEDPPRDEYRDRIGWLCHLTGSAHDMYRCGSEADQVAAIDHLRSRLHRGRLEGALA